jgi:hypothetical protein
MTSIELEQLLRAAGMTKTALASRLGVNPQLFRPSRFNRRKGLRAKRVIEYAIKYVLQ